MTYKVSSGTLSLYSLLITATVLLLLQQLLYRPITVVYLLQTAHLIAGRIAWARQMSRRIEQPMMAFEQHPRILDSDEARKLTRNYNKLTKILLEYEILYHRAWLRQV